MNVYGLLLTIGDAELVEAWCEDQLQFYEAVVCLDGTQDDSVARVVSRFPSVVYLHERDADIAHKTDHGLRKAAHIELLRHFPTARWIMCCHPDEFVYHDPRKIAARAESEGYDLVSWYSPHFYPHPTELADLPARLQKRPQDRFEHYHWSYLGNGCPWIEDRLYRAGRGVEWDGKTQGSVRPLGLFAPAPFHPIFRHYKVINVAVGDYEVAGGSSYYRDRWVGQVHRTGLAFPVSRAEDLFVSHVPKYERCDRYQGWFSQAWNMGDSYCPDAARTNVGTNANFSVREPAHEAMIQDVWDNDLYGIRTARIVPEVVLEIGANIGAFTKLAATVWPSARVIACEADPDNVSLLAENVAGLDHVTVVAMAVIGDEAAQVALPVTEDLKTGVEGRGGDPRPSTRSQAVIVPAISTRRLWIEHGLHCVDWLKIDCQRTGMSILPALSAAGILHQIGWVTGQWDAAADSDVAREEARQAIAIFLGETHVVHFRGPARDGRRVFTAFPRRWRLGP